MKFKVVIHQLGKRVSEKEFVLKNYKDLHYDIYYFLTDNGISEWEAIECARWCELATCGETYNAENFDVYVEETE